MPSLFRLLQDTDRKYREKLVENSKQHSRDRFAGFEDPLEAIISSALIEIQRSGEGKDACRE